MASLQHGISDGTTQLSIRNAQQATWWRFIERRPFDLPCWAICTDRLMPESQNTGRRYDLLVQTMVVDACTRSSAAAGAWGLVSPPTALRQIADAHGAFPTFTRAQRPSPAAALL